MVVERSTAHITLTQTDPAFNYKCIPYFFTCMQSAIHMCVEHFSSYSYVRLKKNNIMQECV